MNKTWQLRALAAYLAVGAPLAASCAREANTLEGEPEGSGGSVSGATSKAGNTAKAGSANAFGGSVGKGGNGGTTMMAEGGEAAAEGGEGTGGSAGSIAGGGGMGGMIGVPPDVLANASVVLHYMTDEVAADTQRIFMKLFIENKSDDPLPMANVKVRYWFTSEAASPPQVTGPYDGGNIAGLTTTFVPDAADSHVLITFSGNDVLKTADLNANEFQLQIQGGPQNQSDDWSFQAAYTARMPHDKITVYLADELIWGCEPSNTCAGDGGSAGDVTGAGGGQ